MGRRSPRSLLPVAWPTVMPGVAGADQRRQPAARGRDGLAWGACGPPPGLQDAPRAAAWRLRPSDLRLPGQTAGYFSGLASGRPQRQLTRAVMVSTEASVSL